MSQFRPTRASPPPRSPRNLESAMEKVAADISRSSTNASVPELTGLTPDEIGLLDAVINRAGPSATTFLTVFKAYNDVLRERGLNPQEVVYYGKLLKLGTMKGKNWGDKWNTVKSQHVDLQARVNNELQHNRHQLTSRPPRREAQTNRPPPPSEDTFTLHSHVDDNEASTSSLNPSSPTNRPQRLPRAQTTASWVSDGLKSSSLLLSPATVPGAPSRKSRRAQHIGPSDSEDNYVPSTPPSYLVTAPHPQFTISPNPNRIALESPAVTSATARKVIANARERRGSVVNQEDVWREIRMGRDEADADEFRRTRLLERCLEVWRQGCRWIVTTNKKMAEARDNFILHVHLRRWRDAVLSRRDIYQRIATLSDNRCRRKALTQWRDRFQARKQNKWRQVMRERMKVIREKRELQLRKDAWAKWRQLYRSHLSSQHYLERLVQRFYECWKQRLVTIGKFETIADGAYQASQERDMIQYWNHWRTSRDMHSSERLMDAQLEAMQLNSFRLCDKMLYAWRVYLREKLSAARDARKVSDRLVTRRALRVWREAKKSKVAEKRLTELEKRRTRTTFYIWLHHARLKIRHRLAEQLIKDNITKRILRDFLMVWTNRVIAIKVQEMDATQNFDVDLQAATFKKWRDAYTRRSEVISLMQSYLFVKREDNIRSVFTRWLRLARVTRHRRITLNEKEDKIRLSVLAYAWDMWRQRFNDEKLCPTERIVMEQTEKNALFKAFGLWRSKTKSLPAIQFHANNVRTRYYEIWRQGMPKALQAKEARNKDRAATLSEVKHLEQLITRLTPQSRQMFWEMGPNLPEKDCL
ncbi:hypothetical protein H0H87_000074 [Tephrocybe sp. NHM501043]|nr:hypothetical protein H0H87_000074 [Tephrocybe sp. NHM501043]